MLPSSTTAALDIVIPCLNAAQRLPQTLDALNPTDMAPLMRVIICDGGSNDATVQIACAYGAEVVNGPRGRGLQLSTGAAAGSAPWLLFLHADTVLGAGWREAVEQYMANPASRVRAAYFHFCLDDGSPAARRLERTVSWRCRTFGLPYGDQGLLITRAFYDSLGGFRPLPLMEDVDLVRRIGRHRLDGLPVDAVTSAERYRCGGWVARSARNLFCLALYFAGVPPRLIQRVYG